jgi:hypothetical protein
VVMKSRSFAKASPGTKAKGTTEADPAVAIFRCRAAHAVAAASIFAARFRGIRDRAALRPASRAALQESAFHVWTASNNVARLVQGA